MCDTTVVFSPSQLILFTVYVKIQFSDFSLWTAFLPWADPPWQLQPRFSGQPLSFCLLFEVTFWPRSWMVYVSSNQGCVSCIMTLQLNCSRVWRNTRSLVLFLCMVFSLGLLKFCLSHTCFPDHVEYPLWRKPTTALFREGPILRQPCSGITSTKRSCMCWISLVVWM